uniref:Uncharacterized protein n=1 Tax=mine drainage metagenome TaxID=410659 RepID=E6PQB2_9ZZZZ
MPPFRYSAFKESLLLKPKLLNERVCIYDLYVNDS